MASEIDICNLALGHIGDEANVQSISPPDGTAQAQHCSRFYAITRDALLEKHAWSFATKRETLAQLTTPTTQAWPYQYQRPANMIKPLGVFIAGNSANDENRQLYLIEEDRVLTQVENAELRFIKRVEDPTAFTPAFIEALAFGLAAKLAGPIVKGTTGTKVANSMRKEAERAYAAAAAENANAQNYKTDHQPDWFRARNARTTGAKVGSRGSL